MARKEAIKAARYPWDETDVLRPGHEETCTTGQGALRVPCRLWEVLEVTWSDLHFYKGSLCQLLRQRQIRAEGKVGKTGSRKTRWETLAVLQRRMMKTWIKAWLLMCQSPSFQTRLVPNWAHYPSAPESLPVMFFLRCLSLLIAFRHPSY